MLNWPPKPALEASSRARRYVTDNSLFALALCPSQKGSTTRFAFLAKTIATAHQPRQQIRADPEQAAHESTDTQGTFDRIPLAEPDQRRLWGQLNSTTNLPPPGRPNSHPRAAFEAVEIQKGEGSVLYFCPRHSFIPLRSPPSGSTRKSATFAPAAHPPSRRRSLRPHDKPTASSTFRVPLTRGSESILTLHSSPRSNRLERS